MKDKQFIKYGKRMFESERWQLEDEGRDVSRLLPAFKAIEQLDLDNEILFQPLVEKMLDTGQALPMRDKYKYHEPSDLAGIRAARPQGPRRMPVKIKDDILYDRMLGAWLGRCAGCLLGKPLESWTCRQIWGYLKGSGQYPLRNYVRGDVARSLLRKYNITIWRDFAFIENIRHMVEDDDTNYTIVALSILKHSGKDFSPTDVAQFWLQHLPINHTCTAEHLAYRNFTMGIPPPRSATFRNPCREWIGAQIRTDFYGYVNPGNPERAAEFAWRDASVSHIKNGIYGAMWVAAALAAAAVESDMRKVVAIGLSEIPANCRFAEGINEVVAWYEKGTSYREAMRRIHKSRPAILHYAAHAIVNTQLVLLGLLWGEGDFEKTICKAVQACYDTDCNSATAGSILGMMRGASKLPAKWIEPLHDKLENGVAMYPRIVNISELAREGMDVYKKINQSIYKHEFC